MNILPDILNQRNSCSLKTKEIKMNFGKQYLFKFVKTRNVPNCLLKISKSVSVDQFYRKLISNINNQENKDPKVKTAIKSTNLPQITNLVFNRSPNKNPPMNELIPNFRKSEREKSFFQNDKKVSHSSNIRKVNFSSNENLKRTSENDNIQIKLKEFKEIKTAETDTIKNLMINPSNKDLKILKSLFAQSLLDHDKQKQRLRLKLPGNISNLRPRFEQQQQLSQKTTMNENTLNVFLSDIEQPTFTQFEFWKQKMFDMSHLDTVMNLEENINQNSIFPRLSNLKFKQIESKIINFLSKFFDESVETDNKLNSIFMTQEVNEPKILHRMKNIRKNAGISNTFFDKFEKIPNSSLTFIQKKIDEILEKLTQEIRSKMENTAASYLFHIKSAKVLHHYSAFAMKTLYEELNKIDQSYGKALLNSAYLNFFVVDFILNLIEEIMKDFLNYNNNNRPIDRKKIFKEKKELHLKVNKLVDEINKLNTGNKSLTEEKTILESEIKNLEETKSNQIMELVKLNCINGFNSHRNLIIGSLIQESITFSEKKPNFNSTNILKFISEISQTYDKILQLISKNENNFEVYVQEFEEKLRNSSYLKSTNSFESLDLPDIIEIYKEYVEKINVAKKEKEKQKLQFNFVNEQRRKSSCLMGLQMKLYKERKSLSKSSTHERQKIENISNVVLENKSNLFGNLHENKSKRENLVLDENKMTNSSVKVDKLILKEKEKVDEKQGFEDVFENKPEESSPEYNLTVKPASESLSIVSDNKSDNSTNEIIVHLELNNQQIQFDKYSCMQKFSEFVKFSHEKVSNGECSIDENVVQKLDAYFYFFIDQFKLNFVDNKSKTILKIALLKYCLLPNFKESPRMKDKMDCIAEILINSAFSPIERKKSIFDIMKDYVQKSNDSEPEILKNIKKVETLDEIDEIKIILNEIDEDETFEKPRRNFLIVNKFDESSRMRKPSLNLNNNETFLQASKSFLDSKRQSFNVLSNNADLSVKKDLKNNEFQRKSFKTLDSRLNKLFQEAVFAIDIISGKSEQREAFMVKNAIISTSKFLKMFEQIIDRISAEESKPQGCILMTFINTCIKLNYNKTLGIKILTQLISSASKISDKNSIAKLFLSFFGIEDFLNENCFWTYILIGNMLKEKNIKRQNGVLRVETKTLLNLLEKHFSFTLEQMSRFANEIDNCKELENNKSFVNFELLFFKIGKELSNSNVSTNTLFFTSNSISKYGGIEQEDFKKMIKIFEPEFNNYGDLKLNDLFAKYANDDKVLDSNRFKKISQENSIFNDKTLHRLLSDFSQKCLFQSISTMNTHWILLKSILMDVLSESSDLSLDIRVYCLSRYIIHESNIYQKIAIASYKIIEVTLMEKIIEKVSQVCENGTEIALLLFK